MITEKCKGCGKNIDKSACGNTYSIITTHRDANERHSVKRYYLCGLCTLNMELAQEGSLLIR